MAVEPCVTDYPFATLEGLLEARPSLILHDMSLSKAVAAELAKRFLRPGDQLWWWERLNRPFWYRQTASFQDLLDRLNQVFPNPDETLLLFPTDDQPPPWLLFEGTRDDIAFAMGESSSSEFLIARRTLDTIVFDTHHNMMYVAGSDPAMLLRLHPEFTLAPAGDEPR